MATYSYNARNQIASTIIENGLFTATRSYDTAGRLTGISNGALDSTAYTLSPDGRRTGITRNGDSESYGYDNARQVTSGTYGGLSTTQSWNYDPAGNRQNATTNGVTTNYLSNAVNEYFSITGGGHVPPAPTYDPNGNATTWNVLPLGSSSLVSCVFGWNIHNELTSATNSSGDTASYGYDALGRRVKRTESIGGTSTTTWFFYNGWNIELEHNGTTHTRRHTWGLDLSGDLQGAGGVGGLVMVEHLDTGSGPEPYFPTFDGNGNITAWVDANGTVVARQRYDAFGNILSQTGIAPSNYAFSTKPKERVTGLYYYGYRYYDPVTGRWVNRDPIEEEGGSNLMAFNANRGTDRWDFLGLIISAEYNIQEQTFKAQDLDGLSDAFDCQKDRCSCGTNDPSQTGKPSGPLPRGKYNIYTRPGNFKGLGEAWILDPQDADERNDIWDTDKGFGRWSLRIHLWVKERKDKGSQGCIVLSESCHKQFSDMVSRTKAGKTFKINTPAEDENGGLVPDPGGKGGIKWDKPFKAKFLGTLEVK